MGTMNAATGQSDGFHVADINGVSLPGAQQRVDIRMKNVRGGKGLNDECRLSHFVPSLVRDSRQVARHRRDPEDARRTDQSVLRKHAPDLSPCAGEKRGGDPALRCPSGMQEFRLCSIDPAFQQDRPQSCRKCRRRWPSHSRSNARACWQDTTHQKSQKARWDGSPVDGTDPVRRCSTRQEISLPTAMAAIRSCPETGPSSATARAAATAGLLM